MAVVSSPEAARLAAELTKRMGEGPFTARELAAELAAADTPTDLIIAFEFAVCRAAAAREADELDDGLWGPTPIEEELVQAHRVGQRAQQQALAAVLADAFTRRQAAAQLGISPQAVSKRHAAGSLVALARGREQHFPAWQFHEGASLPGLAETIAAYPGGPLSLSLWATTPNVDLDGLTPAQALARRGGVERVLDAVRSISAAAW